MVNVYTVRFITWHVDTLQQVNDQRKFGSTQFWGKKEFFVNLPLNQRYVGHLWLNM